MIARPRHPGNPTRTIGTQSGRTDDKRRFWLTHNGASPKYALPDLGVLIASNAIPGSAGRLVWALAQSTLIYLLASYTTHRRLQPWCPWCKGGGGGHDDEPATPEPVEPERRRQPI